VLCDQLETQHNNAAVAHEQLVSQLLATLTLSQNAADFSANWQRIAAYFDTLFTTEASIDALKQTLLQLAVMGKLVPQDPNDEPASELLKHILKERDRLIEHEGSRTIANDEIQQSEMYIATPDNWKYCRLGNLARFIDYRGKTPNKVSSGVSLITAKNVRYGYISRDPEEYISAAEYVSWMTRGFPRIGDMLFTTEAPLGNIAIVDIAEKFALAQRVICFQLHDQAIGTYLKIAVMSEQVQEQLINAATGMTATGIKASKLKEIPVPIPPLAEQHRIVAKVDELMALCDQLKSRITDSNQLQKKMADVLVEQAISH
jgi:type I restriction enzyme S subunit